MSMGEKIARAINGALEDVENKVEEAIGKWMSAKATEVMPREDRQDLVLWPSVGTVIWPYPSSVIPNFQVYVQRFFLVLRLLR